MFATITRSKYIIFYKANGLSKLPKNVLLDDSIEILESDKDSSVFKKSFEFDNKKKKEKVEDLSTDQVPSNAFTYIPVSILLEDQIVTNLKLNNLGVYLLTKPRTRTMLNGILPLNISSRSTAVKGGFINYFKATFNTIQDPIPEGFKEEYTLSFITPKNITVEDLEIHLTKLPKIKPAAGGPPYAYKKASIESVSGRKFKRNN